MIAFLSIIYILPSNTDVTDQDSGADDIVGMDNLPRSSLLTEAEYFLGVIRNGWNISYGKLQKRIKRKLLFMLSYIRTLTAMMSCHFLLSPKNLQRRE